MTYHAAYLANLTNLVSASHYKIRIKWWIQVVDSSGASHCHDINEFQSYQLCHKSTAVPPSPPSLKRVSSCLLLDPFLSLACFGWSWCEILDGCCCRLFWPTTCLRFWYILVFWNPSKWVFFWHWVANYRSVISAKLFTMETWRASYTVPHMIICFLLGVLLLGSELSSALSGCNQPCNTGNDCQGQLTCISSKCNDDPSVGTHICGGKWH